MIDGIGYLRLIDNKGQTLAESYNVQVRVTDSARHTLDRTLQVSIIKSSGFLTSTNIYADVDESFNATIRVTVDPTAGIPDITALDIPGWMSFFDNGDGTATISGFPSFENIFSVSLRMTTPGGIDYDKTFRLPTTIPVLKDSGINTSNTEVTVTVTDSDDNGGSFGWLLILAVVC